MRCRGRRVQMCFVRHAEAREPGIGAVRPCDGKLAVIAAVAYERVNTGECSAIGQLGFEFGQDATGKRPEPGNQPGPGQRDAGADDSTLSEACKVLSAQTP